MTWKTSQHIPWLVDAGTPITTADGLTVKVLEFRHRQDEKILSAWARHFRNHYCLDTQIAKLSGGTGLSRSEFLKQIKFPDSRIRPGPSIRAGDFGEILIADYLEFVLDFWVPRTRYEAKAIRNESEKGSDIIGCKFIEEGRESPDDILAIFESKTQFSGNKAKARLQDAINHSAKDYLRQAESLNAAKQRFLDRQQPDDAKKIERSQNKSDRRYKQIFGAAALFSSPVFDANVISSSDATGHPQRTDLSLVVIRGDAMMRLVTDLYERAADEA